MTHPRNAYHIVALMTALVLSVCHGATLAAETAKPATGVTATATPPGAAAPAGGAKASPPATAPATSAAKAGWPTDEEVKATIFKVENDIYASETNKTVWHVKEMKHEVKSVQFAQETTQKQMRYGAAAQTVYPVKVLYTRITEYTTKPETREEQGKDGVWFFYKDSFGNWTCKYGNE